MPPSNARHAGEVVLVAKPAPAFTAVPVKDVTSFPVVAVTHVLAPFVPFRKIVPEPRFDANTEGLDGAEAAAVPPVVVVWKSHPAIKVCARPHSATSRRGTNTKRIRNARTLEGWKRQLMERGVVGTG